MIPSINILTAEGIPLSSACIEVCDYQYDIDEKKTKRVTASRNNGVLEEKVGEAVTGDPEISTITFCADVWVNQQLKSQKKPSIELKDKEGSNAITIDFSQHQEMQDYWQRFAEQATNSQKVEGTCEHYIKTVLIPNLRG